MKIEKKHVEGNPLFVEEGQDLFVCCNKKGLPEHEGGSICVDTTDKHQRMIVAACGKVYLMEELQSVKVTSERISEIYELLDDFDKYEEQGRNTQ